MAPYVSTLLVFLLLTGCTTPLCLQDRTLCSLVIFPKLVAFRVRLFILIFLFRRLSVTFTVLRAIFSIHLAKSNLFSATKATCKKFFYFYNIYYQTFIQLFKLKNNTVHFVFKFQNNENGFVFSQVEHSKNFTWSSLQYKYLCSHNKTKLTY